MVSTTSLILSVFCATAASQTIQGWVNTPSQTDVPAPLDDPFYTTEPENLASYKNGDVIESRDVGIGYFQRVKYAKQLKYRSENTRGEPVYAITTVVVPENAQLDKLVSFLAFEDAAYLNCAPSYQFVAHQQNTGVSQAYADVQPIFDHGWVLNLPDHEGRNNSFMAGPLEGKLTLDSLRAVRNAKDLFGLKDGYEHVMWGYSGGSVASGWAAEMLPHYAPDVEVKFMAMGGIIANSTGTVVKINKSIFTGFLVAGMFGLASEYTEMWDIIPKYVRPGKLDHLVDSLHMCQMDELSSYLLQDVFNDSFYGFDVLYDPVINNILEGVMLGKAVPQMPMYLYHAIFDDIQPIKYVDALVDYYCQNGADLEYSRIPLNEHVTSQTSWSNVVISKIDDAFRNKLPSGCTRHQQ